MRQWLTRHLETIRAVAATSLAFSIILGAMAFSLRRPAPAAIVIQPLTPLPTASKAPTASPGPMKVYVVGAVARPGVYALPWDSRVEQAIASAGGATVDADLLRVNLAQRIHDQQQIYVPSRAEEATPVLPTLAPPTPSAGSASSSGRTINVNTANASELETLPGIGPVLAQRIIDYCQTHGPFQRLEDLKKVKGIGESTFERIQGMITLE
jgi:competence protein ComEA